MSPIRIFVVGRSGQVAQAIVAAADGRADLSLHCVGRPDADLAAPDQLLSALDAHRPDVILNAAAYTAVDKAESEPDLADAINHIGPKRLAEWSGAAGIPLIHMSTDCVFDGTKTGGYVETDPPSPISVYGRTKADGETAVAAATHKHLIARVCWVHSPFAGSFPKIMLTLAKDRETLSVVGDQWGRPTHASDLADGLLTMATRCLQPDFADWGIYHLAGAGETNRADMAKAIFEDSAAQRGPVADVVPISTDDYGAAAARPLNARLDSPRAKAVFGWTPVPWRHRLTDTVNSLLDGELSS
ncbi:MAG: dTDP-4-dehydrorhamnose reductase [Pseudomonadota bacterium]